MDRLDLLGTGIQIARASRRIAMESVVAGIGLSVPGMIAAAFGYLTPVQGALLQEVIDVAVVLNALRALRIVRASRAGRCGDGLLRGTPHRRPEASVGRPCRTADPHGAT